MHSSSSHTKEATDILFKVIAMQKTHIHTTIVFDHKDSMIDLSILKQACFPEYQKAQCAFKDLMIH